MRVNERQECWRRGHNIETRKDQKTKRNDFKWKIVNNSPSEAVLCIRIHSLQQ